MSKFSLSVAAATLLLGLSVSSSAQTNAAPPRRLDFDHLIPNVPGKSFKTVVVNYAPGQVSPAHAHAQSAFVIAYVLEGEIQSAVNGEPAKTYKVGEYWTENPGDHHTTSGNASKTNPAKLLAMFIVDTKDTVLTRSLPAEKR
ncbi:MAG TPA: cupin domain-containing protein [Gemmatimonadaceae bacterium]|jgi:quercetin dioxygenase-like cupin family protein